MLTDREIVLDQALMAVLSESIASGLDTKTLVDNAIAGLLRGTTYRWVGFPHVENAVQALNNAYSQAVICIQNK